MGGGAAGDGSEGGAGKHRLEKGEVAGEVKLAAVCLRVSFRFFFSFSFLLLIQKRQVVWFLWWTQLGLVKLR